MLGTVLRPPMSQDIVVRLPDTAIRESNSVFSQGQSPPVPEVQRREEAECWQRGLDLSPRLTPTPLRV